MLLQTLVAFIAISQAGGRANVAGAFNLEIDGSDAGWIAAVEGGGAERKVVIEKLGTDRHPKKSIGNVEYGDFTVTTGLSESAVLLDWIQSLWRRDVVEHDGAVTVAPVSGADPERHEYVDAILTETVFPACDTEDDEAAYVTVKLKPKYTRVVTPKALDTGKTPAYVWRPRDFKLEIDGLVTTDVRRVEPLRVTATDVSNLVFSFPSSSATARSVRAYFDDFVIDGNHDDGNERHATLYFLNEDGKALVAIDMFDCGIYRLSPMGDVTKAELYCEFFELQ